MLASRSLDTDLAQSEKQTLFRFSSLYVLLTLIIISIFSFIYFELQKDLMLVQKKSTLQKYSKELTQSLKQLHINFDKTQIYPRSDKYDSAIFDNEKKLIFETSKTKLRLDKILYLENGMIYLVDIPESYYLGARYVIVKIKDDGIWLEQTKKEIIIFAILIIFPMLVIGYILLRLFLKPMREVISFLDKFIKDTTHELNTPVSTIVANIEMIDKTSLDEKLLKKINRIDIGAKTISNIYQDLTYLTLSDKITANDENIDIGHLITQRVEYFTSLAQAKKVILNKNIIKNSTMYIDKFKISKLLDNLISNAIKYNNVGGKIVVSVDGNKLSVKDTGIGIAKKNISKLQNRYVRFNSSSGGFGIGLNIVFQIAQEYNLTINIDSKENVGTEVIITW